VLIGVVRIIARTINSANPARPADELAIDRRSVDLFTDRTGFDRDWFEREIASEDALSDADAIQTGIVHEFGGLMPVCYPAWPDAAQRLAKEARSFTYLVT
jgi:hypothetical protein